MTALVLAEHDNVLLNLATAKAVTAARACAPEVHVLVAGENCRAVAVQAAKLEGVSSVLLAEAPHYRVPLAEQVAPLMAREAHAYTHIMAAATTTGKDILPRVAALLGVAQVSDIVRVVAPDTFVRPIYAGNALETVQATDAIKVLTVRVTAFPAAEGKEAHASIAPIAPEAASEMSAFVSQEAASTGRPDLAAARVVIAGGRGLGSKENFLLLEKLADRLSAAIGASRAAVDAGFAPNDWQVGQTGKVVAPELYIAVGISGAIQHLAGMKDSRVIVAINKDENAPIFEIADYGLVGDLFVVLPELEKALGSSA